jgi:ADP-heptose:LPS heptosyltransferase
VPDGTTSILRRLAIGIPWKQPRIWTVGPQTIHPPTEAAGNYLVCATAGIGDALMAVPLLRVLKAARPDSRITVLANPVNAALLANQPAVDDVVVFPHPPALGRLMALAWELRRRGLAAAFGAIPSDLLSLSLVLKLSGIPRRIKQRLTAGQGNQGWEHWFTDLLDSGPEKHKVFANLDLLVPIGIRPGDIPHQTVVSMLQ